MAKYTCHVCGYPDLDEPPRSGNEKIPSFDICDCCGIQFGYEDSNESNVIEYRKKWIESGGEWFNKQKRPKEWSMIEQLKNINVII